MGRKETKSSLFSDNLILYIENPKKPINKLLKIKTWKLGVPKWWADIRGGSLEPKKELHPPPGNVICVPQGPRGPLRRWGQGSYGHMSLCSPSLFIGSVGVSGHVSLARSAWHSSSYCTGWTGREGELVREVSCPGTCPCAACSLEVNK